MKDVNGSSFYLLADPADWPVSSGVAWSGSTCALAGRQQWRLPTTLTPAAAQTTLKSSQPVVVDTFSGIARIMHDGSGIESLDGTSWVPLTDQNGTALVPITGTFIGMSLGGARLALLASNGTTSYLELFDLRGRWPLDSADNPALPLSLDTAGSALAVSADGQIFVLVEGGVAIFEGGPIDTFVSAQPVQFAPLAANPNPLRQTTLIANRPGGTPLAMTVDPNRLAILLDQGTEAQTVALLDRSAGTWTSTPIIASDGTPLPYMTDIALPNDDLIALMAPNPTPTAPCDCAVVTVSATPSVTLAPLRYPTLNQYAPRFASIPGPDVFYLGILPPDPLGVIPDQPQPRRLLPLPYPAYVTSGAVARFGVLASDPDQVWHRLYAEANLPHGTALAVWARAAESSVAPADQAALLTTILYATTGVSTLGTSEATQIASGNPLSLSAPTTTLAAALALAPFHLQPPLVAGTLPSELPFHPGLAALAGMPGALYEVLLQRSVGLNRRLTGTHLDLVIVATGDGRHSPCLRAIRVYAPRFCYQDQYLPMLFHQTSIPDETDLASTPSAPDFRERLVANLEGLLTPIEDRVAAAEYLLDPYAAPSAMLPWLGSYFGRDLDPGWPEARTRRALSVMGQQFRERGTYRGVCLALDVATDGAVARGEVVLLETHRLRRTDATVLGYALSGLNVLTGEAVLSGNSIVGDTLVLSAQRAIDVLSLLAPSAASAADAATVSRFLDEYADRIQVAAILQGPSASALRPAVLAVLQAELPAQLAFDIVVANPGFVLGLAPLLDVDTFLKPPAAPAPLTLGQSVIGKDAIVRGPAALRQ